jgi:genome maintenance exonuclease 1
MITQLQTPNGRHYDTPKGVFPSVTTILDATKSSEERDHLRKWQHKMDKIHGTDGGKAQQEAARERGIKIHAAIAHSLYNIGTPEITPELQPYWESVKRIVKAIANPGYCEHAVYHPEHKYAGTLDLIADWQGKTTVIDWKTSYRTKRLAWIGDHTLQVAAYAKAYEWLHGIPIKQTLIVIITPEKAQLFQFDLSEMEQHWEKWLTRLSQYYSIFPQLPPTPDNEAQEQQQASC